MNKICYAHSAISFTAGPLLLPVRAVKQHILNKSCDNGFYINFLRV